MSHSPVGSFCPVCWLRIWILKHPGAVAGFLFSLLIWSPGILDTDTVWQLEQAQSNRYNDWHPPLMAYIWHLLLSIFPRSWGIFLFAQVCYWIGLSLTLSKLLGMRVRPTAIVVFIIGLLPFHFSVMGLVWKDALFGALMLFAVGVCLHLDVRQSFWNKFVILVLLFVASGIRHNGFFATAPILIWMFGFTKDLWSWRKGLILGILTIAVVSIGNKLLMSLIVEEEAGAPEQVLTTFDLGGITYYSGQNVFPSIYEIQASDIIKIYDSSTVYPLLWEDIGTEHLKRPGFLAAPAAELSGVLLAWGSAILNYPTAYLRHRGKFFLKFLGIGIDWGDAQYTPFYLPEDASVFRSDFLAKMYIDFSRKFESLISFRIYYFVLVMFACYFYLCHVRKQSLSANSNRAEMIFFYSGVFYLISFLIAGVASDFRYSFWVVLCSVLLFIRTIVIYVQDRVSKVVSLNSNSGTSPRAKEDPQANFRQRIR